MRYELIEYDVWGNDKDGYEVNNSFSTGVIVDIPKDASDRDIVAILRRDGIIRKGVRTESVEIDGDDDLYLQHRRTGRPAFMLRRID